MCGKVDLLRIAYVQVFIYFPKKDVNHILSMFCWDVSCGEDLGTDQNPK